MARAVTVGAAQLGPISLNESRAQVIDRLVVLLEKAKRRGCDLVVFPELALTTFFPRWFFENDDDLEKFFEKEMPGEETNRLFDVARELQIGFYIGYAESVNEDQRRRHFNTSVIVDKSGNIVSKYRKIHLPGHRTYEPTWPYQHLEKRYFEVGNLGWPVVRAFGGLVGMCICNDRRWPETYRVMGLQGVEMIFLGYNTPAHIPNAPETSRLGYHHNHLVMQAGAYQNGTWVVGVAKAGNEEGCELIGGSAIISPGGEIVAKSVTTGDELISAECDLDQCNPYKTTIFNFEAHREPAQYRLIVEQKGVKRPAETQ